MRCAGRLLQCKGIGVSQRSEVEARQLFQTSKRDLVGPELTEDELDVLDQVALVATFQNARGSCTPRYTGSPASNTGPVKTQAANPLVSALSSR